MVDILNRLICRLSKVFFLILV